MLCPTHSQPHFSRLCANFTWTLNTIYSTGGLPYWEIQRYVIFVHNKFNKQLTMFSFYWNMSNKATFMWSVTYDVWLPWLSQDQKRLHARWPGIDTPRETYYFPDRLSKWGIIKCMQKITFIIYKVTSFVNEPCTSIEAEWWIHALVK